MNGCNADDAYPLLYGIGARFIKGSIGIHIMGYFMFSQRAEGDFCFIAESRFLFKTHQTNARYHPMSTA